MAQTIKLKRSANSTLTSGQGIPTTSNLELGEVAINTYHGKMYIKKNDGSESIVEVGAADNTKLPLAGGTMTGALNMGGNRITDSGDLTLEAPVDIILDAEGNDVILKDNGTTFGQLTNDSGNLVIYNSGSQMLKGLSTGPNAQFMGNLTVSGNLNVTGTTTQTGSVVTNNNFTGLTNANSGNTTDFGFYGKYVESSTTKYAGMYYDASVDNTFKLFCDTQTAPTTTVNESATGYALASLSIAGLTTTGNVGIGIANTTAPLVVQAQSNAVGINLVGRTSDSIGELNFAASNGTNQSSIQSRTTDLRIKTLQNIPLTFHTDNTERVRIDAIGRVGIGTNIPSNNLHIASTAAAIRLEDTDNTSYGQIIYNTAAGGLIIRSDENNQAGQSSSNIIFETDGTARVRINANGRVGIGTDSPGSPLDVVSNSVSSADAGIRLISNSGGNAIVRIGERSNDKARFHMYDGTTEKIAFYTDGTANHISAGNLGIGTSSPDSLLHLKSTGDTRMTIESPDANDAYINFSGASNEMSLGFDKSDSAMYITNHGTITANRRVTIKTNGNVGIGITSPDKMFVVQGPGAEVVISDTDTTDTPRLRFRETGTTSGTIHTDASHMIFSAPTTERMRINPSGYVGIGTTAPAARLHISGNSDVSDEDCMLIIDDIDGSAASRIPAIMFRSNTGGTVTNQARIRGHDTLGMVLSGSSALGNDLVVQSGGVGIGTNSPDNKLHVYKGNSGHSWSFDGGDGLILENSDSVSINITTPAANSGNILFSDANARGQGRIVYDHSSDYMAFMTAGVSNEHMRINSSGNVGIGTTSPSSALHVKSTGNGEVNIERASGALINLQAQASAAYIGTNSNHLFGLKANGSVRLKIATGGAITFNDEYTFPTSDGSPNQVLKTDGSGNLSFVTIAGAGAITEIEDSDGDTKIQVEESSDEDIIRFDTAGTERMTLSPSVLSVRGTTNPEIELLPNGTVGNADLRFDGTTFDIRSNSSSASLLLSTSSTERLRINSNGRVGIGHTSPNGQLHVSAGNNTSVSIGDATNPAIQVGGTTNYRFGVYTDGEAGYIENKNGDDGLVFRVKTAGEAMRIDGGTGNVGIGTTAPTHQLHVAGAGDIVIEDTDGGSAHLRLKSSASGSTTSHWKLKTNAANNFYIDNDQQGTSNLTILSDGRAGIGISAPTAALSVVDTSQTTTGQGLAGLRVHRPNATSQYGYVDYDNGGGGINVGSFYSGGGNSVYGTFMFRQHNAAGSQTPMAIGNTGNVGFGTTSPADKIHLSGGNLLFERGVELRSKDTGGNLRTIARVNSSNELEYGWSASGPVKFMGGTSYTERMRVHTNGFIGIGTTSPASRLQINGTSADGWNRNIGLSIDGTEIGKIVVDSAGIKYRTMVSGDHHYFRNSANSTTFLIRDDGRVGIGTTSPARTLDIVGDFGVKQGSSAIAFNEYSNGATIWIDGSDGDFTGGDYFNISAFGTTDLSFGLAGASLVTFKSDGDVGIGTASPASALSSSNRNLTIEDSDGADIKFKHTGGMDLTVGVTSSNTGYIWTGGSYNILFGTAGTERMRLNSAGDLLIGKTSTGAGTAGIAFLQQDIITTTRDGGYSLLASRLSSDGEIIRIQRSGTTVGEIGSEGTDSLYISGATSTGSGLRFHPSAGNILPVRNRVTIDSTIDLGSSARRFRNIHASSAVNVGHASIQSDSTTTSATTQVAIDAFVASQFRSAEFTIQVTNSTDSTYHITKVLLIHDGTTPGITEYGTVFTGSAAEATFDADISSGNVRLLATPASTDSMTFKVVRHCITV